MPLAFCACAKTQPDTWRGTTSPQNLLVTTNGYDISNVSCVVDGTTVTVSGVDGTDYTNTSGPPNYAPSYLRIDLDGEDPGAQSTTRKVDLTRSTWTTTVNVDWPPKSCSVELNGPD